MQTPYSTESLPQERWLPELRRIVTKVNRTFSRVFAKIGCAGEVTLHDQEDDYDRYAINIKCVSAGCFTPTFCCNVSSMRAGAAVSA